MIRVIGLLVILVPCVLMDLKTNKLPLFYMLLCGAVALLLNLLCGLEGLMSMAVGGVIGLVFLLIARLTKETVGYGDGVLILIIGLWCGGADTLGILLMALILAGLVGGIIVLVKKKGRSFRIAFSPYLALSSLILSGIRLIGS